MISKQRGIIGGLALIGLLSLLVIGARGVCASDHGLVGVIAIDMNENGVFNETSDVQIGVFARFDQSSFTLGEADQLSENLHNLIKEIILPQLSEISEQILISMVTPSDLVAQGYDGETLTDLIFNQGIGAVTINYQGQTYNWKALLGLYVYKTTHYTGTADVRLDIWLDLGIYYDLLLTYVPELAIYFPEGTTYYGAFELKESFLDLLSYVSSPQEGLEQD